MNPYWPHDSRDATLELGLKQISRYADKVGRDATQTLVIFDRTLSGRGMPWEERLRRESHGDLVVRWL